MPDFSQTLARWLLGFSTSSQTLIPPRGVQHPPTCSQKVYNRIHYCLCFDAFLIWDDHWGREIESIMFFWTIKWVLVWTGVILSSILWCWWPAAGFPHLGPPFERPALCVCIFLLIGMRLCKLVFVVNAVSFQCASRIRLEAAGIGVTKSADLMPPRSSAWINGHKPQNSMILEWVSTWLEICCKFVGISFVSMSSVGKGEKP